MGKSPVEQYISLSSIEVWDGQGTNQVDTYLWI
jgi:hypothetical protein